MLKVNLSVDLNFGGETILGTYRAMFVILFYSVISAMPCSETDIFASQSEEDAEVSVESSGTVPDDSDFVKGSRDRR